jgi:hypothetical protein
LPSPLASVDISLLLRGAGLLAARAPYTTKFPIWHKDIPALNVLIIPRHG